MPFVQRQVQPKFIVRRQSSSTPRSTQLQDNELEAITNLTLSNAMRQLASLLALSKEIFNELNSELEVISERSCRLKGKLVKIQSRVCDPSYDAKLVVVPESDLVTFVQTKNHYKTSYEITTNLFTPDSRSEALKKLYEGASKTPVPAIMAMDEIVGNKRRSSDAFICTPIIGQVRRKMKNNIDIEIETRMPAAVEDLRKWTSNEAIGDVTVGCDGATRVLHNATITEHEISDRPVSQDSTDAIRIMNESRMVEEEDDKDSTVDYRLPSPEEQCKILASKYPAQVIRVNTSGNMFDRQSMVRKSLLHVQNGLHALQVVNGNDINTDSVQRRSRSRKPHGNRRNTIVGIGQKEIKTITENSHDDETKENSTLNDEDKVDANGAFQRSKSNEIFKKDFMFGEARRSSSHFNSLKQWGKNRFKIINRLSSASDSNNRGSLRVKTNSNDDIDDFNVIEAINKRQRKINEKDQRRLAHDRKSSYSSDDRSEGSNTQTSSSSTQKINSLMNPVKMRDPNVLRKQRKQRGPNDEPHSSSGNWSASSESGRASIESEITSTTVTQPKSSTSNSSLNYTTHTYPSSSGPPSSIISRRRFMNTSASSSIASEGTATPEMPQMFDTHDEGETSSVYSCDTEGYYTSFHVDSGLKTLKEEEPMTPNHSSTALSSTNSFESSGNMTVISPECEYEVFGKGSTTTSSSAGTVCTAVMHFDSDRPSVPERKSSLGKLNRADSTSSWDNLLRSPSTSTVGSTLEKGATIKRNGVLLQKEVQALVHQHKQEALVKRIESPDSGNNTSSSPVDSNSSPTDQNARVCSEFECSESSDLECIERTERIKEKTTININRIPSMCVITPTPSDDDEVKLTKNEENMNKQQQQQKTQSHDKDVGYASVSVLNINNRKQQQQRKNGPLTMIGKLRGVLQPLIKSPSKEKYESPDEYVTITDLKTPSKTTAKSNGIYYSSEVLKRNLATVLSGNLNEETEYVSLNELPCNARSESNLLVDSEGREIDNLNERDDDNRNRVKFDAHGKPIFDSSSLKRKKSAITSFNPGECVKESVEIVEKTSIKTIPEINKTLPEKINNTKLIESPIYRRPVLNNIRPVISQTKLTKNNSSTSANSEIVTENNNILIEKVENTAATMSKFSENSLYERPSGSLSINLNSSSSKILSNGNGLPRGAYVNLQDAAPLFNGPPVYSPPSPSCSASIFSTSSEDYQHFLHDNKIMSSSLNSEYIYDNGYNSAPAPSYQQVNNIYWTLQNHSKGNNPHYLNEDPYRISRDDSKLRQQQEQQHQHQLPSNTTTISNNHDNQRMYESLYAKPNENFRNNLKTTPLGFEFFSPVTSSKQERVQVQEDEREMIARDRIFSTSTPQKQNDLNLNSPSKISATEELLRSRLSHMGVRSHGNSPINSGRSTPSRVFEPQQSSRTRHSWSSNNVNVPPSTTCSDRMGAPKTSLMDFKKLLLNKTGTNKSSAKISAVEQLKLSREKLNQSAPSPTRNIMNSSMNILDLSSSPKTFATRRMIRQGQFGQGLSGSPTKMNAKQKQAWRLQNMKSDVISTAIPEAANDEEVQESASSVIFKKPVEKIKSPEIVIEEVEEEIQSMSLKENLFIKQQENNFTEKEIREQRKAVNLRSNIPTSTFLSVTSSETAKNNDNVVSGESQPNKPNLPISLETAL